MRTVRRTWTNVAAGVLVAGIALSGCGSDGEESGVGTGDAEVGEDAGVELTEENFFSEITAAQVEAGSSHVTMDAGDAMGGGAIEGDVVLGEDVADTALQMTVDTGEAQGAPGPIEIRLVDNVFYMQLGEMTGGKFIEVDLEDDSNPIGKQFGSLSDTFDPQSQLELLEENITGFEQAGEPEQLDGVEATPYRISVDSKAILESLSDELGQADGGAQLPPDVPEEIIYTMFVGPDNLPRRIAMDLAGMSTTVDYTKWGEDVTVEAPSADEISDENPFESAA